MALRRLHQGAFRWPASGDVVHTINQQEWLLLTAGIDWQRNRLLALDKLIGTFGFLSRVDLVHSLRFWPSGRL